MKFARLLAFVAIVSPLCISAQNFFIDTVYFDFDRYNLRDEYRTEVDSIIARLTGFPSYYIEVFGHTDNIGTDFYNTQLSEKRAQEVVNFFLEKGLDKDRITMKGFGTEKPAAPNETFEGRKVNRRAEIAVIFTTSLEPTTEVPPVVVAEPPVEKPVEKIVSDEIESVDKPITVFTNRRTVIRGSDGTRVIIPPRAFDTDEEKVTIEMVELLKRKDILLVGMPTITNEGPLETAGMVMIEARNARGRLVKVKPETPITVEIPAEYESDNMKVYLGRGGNRTSRLKRKAGIKDFNPVQNWTASDLGIAWKDTGEIGSHYEFKVSDLERFNLARPLHYALSTDPKAEGVDFAVKLKGPRFDKDTKVLIVGDPVTTVIPLTGTSKRLFTGTNIRQLDPNKKIILLATEEDNKETPYVATRELTIVDVAKKPKGKKTEAQRPVVTVKLKFRKKTDKEFQDLVGKL